MKTGLMLRWSIFLILFIFNVLAALSQEVMPLYFGEIPNSKTNFIKEEYTSGMYKGITVPSVEIYLPEKGTANGTAVIICPGGGYGVIVFQGEGVTTAKEFAKNGVAAFVLKYRLPDDSIVTDKTIGPLQDALQAIKLVRDNAFKWGIDIHKVGIMGFSAGGHLASTVTTHYQQQIIKNDTQTSLRPDFQILVYPVISMQDSLTHMGSRNNLLGKKPTKATIDFYSNELQVNDSTPPAYITHASDDKLVDVDNSVNYFEQLRKHKIPVELMIYPKGGHGFIFGRKNWMLPLFEWMKERDLITN